MYNLTEILHTKSTPAEVNAALEAVAQSKPGPIELDLALRGIAKRIGASLKPVKQSYDATLKKLNLSPPDIGLAIVLELLEKEFGYGLHLKLTKDGFLYAFDTTHWVRMSENKIRADLQTIAAKYHSLSNKSLHSLVNDALGALKDYLGNNEDILSLTDEPPPVINCLNGELWFGEAGSVELRPHKPESQLLYCLPYEYDPAATCQVFDDAVLDIFGNSKEPQELRRHFLEMLGYAIQPSRTIPCFWLMIGHGANGKTSLLQTVCRLISPEYLHNVDISQFGRDKFSVSQLPGKLLMIDDDIKMDAVLEDGLLKKISESKLLSARQPYGKQTFTFLNAAMPVLIGNHFPKCNDLSTGLLRRAMVIPFKRQFLAAEQDPNKFIHIWENEMSGVLNRAIEGFKRVSQRKSFKPPQDCVDALEEFLTHGNPLYAFLADCIEPDAHQRVPFPTVRDAYAIWAKSQNISNLSVLNKTLKRRLQSLNYVIGIYNGYPSIMGYRLRSQFCTEKAT